MSGGYRTPDGDGLGALLRELAGIKERLGELEAPTGTSANSLVQQVQEAIANIETTVNAAIAANSYTAPVIDAKIASPGTIAPVDINASGTMNISGPIFTPHGRANPVVTSYVAAYINSDGRLGATPSSRRFKQQVTAWTFDWQALFAIELFEFKYNAAVEELGKLAPREVGLMAEDLDALGLTWLVVYDDDGMPWAVAYEKFSLVLLPVVQDHERRLRALEALTQPPSAVGN